MAQFRRCFAPLSLVQLASRSLPERVLALLPQDAGLRERVDEARNARACHSCGLPNRLVIHCLLLTSDYGSATFVQASGGWQFKNAAQLHLCPSCVLHWRTHAVPPCGRSGDPELGACRGESAIYELKDFEDDPLTWALAWFCESHAGDYLCDNFDALERFGVMGGAMTSLLTALRERIAEQRRR